MLFHYNGHGVPKPTQNGEIWVFNKVSVTVCVCVLGRGTCICKWVSDSFDAFSVFYHRTTPSTFLCPCMTYKLGWGVPQFISMIVLMPVTVILYL